MRRPLWSMSASSVIASGAPRRTEATTAGRVVSTRSATSIIRSSFRCSPITRACSPSRRSARKSSPSRRRVRPCEHFSRRRSIRQHRSSATMTSPGTKRPLAGVRRLLCCGLRAPPGCAVGRILNRRLAAPPPEISARYRGFGSRMGFKRTVDHLHFLHPPPDQAKCLARALGDQSQRETPSPTNASAPCRSLGVPVVTTRPSGNRRSERYLHRRPPPAPSHPCRPERCV